VPAKEIRICIDISFTIGECPDNPCHTSENNFWQLDGFNFTMYTHRHPIAFFPGERTTRS